MAGTLHEERLPGDNHYVMVDVGGTWAFIPGQSDCSIDVSQAADNVTNKSDGGHERNLSGNSSGAITINGVYIWDGRAIYEVFEYAQYYHENVWLMEVWTDSDGNHTQIRRGEAVVTGFNRNSATGTHLGYTITGTVSGPWSVDDLE